MNPKPIWVDGAVYDLSVLKAHLPVVRCVKSQDIPCAGSTRLIMGVMAGSVGSHFSASALVYGEYLLKPGPSYWQQCDPGVRMFVLEKDWQKHFGLEENEFGPVSP